MIVFAHGLEGSPVGSKVKSLSARFGVTAPDFTGLSVGDRVDLLVESVGDHQDLILVGSSLGGLVVSLSLNYLRDQVAGVVLMAPAIHRGDPLPLPHPDTVIIHGSSDDVVPLSSSLLFSEKHGLVCHIVNDGHRLMKSHHVMLDAVETILESLRSRRADQELEKHTLIDAGVFLADLICKGVPTGIPRHLWACKTDRNKLLKEVLESPGVIEMPDGTFSRIPGSTLPVHPDTVSVSDGVVVQRAPGGEKSTAFSVEALQPLGPTLGLTAEMLGLDPCTSALELYGHYIVDPPLAEALAQVGGVVVERWGLQIWCKAGAAGDLTLRVALLSLFHSRGPEDHSPPGPHP